MFSAEKLFRNVLQINKKTAAMEAQACNITENPTLLKGIF